MSFNRNKYDQCSYKNELNRNVGILGYVMDVKKYENQNQCRHQRGIVSGNDCSHLANGSLIDLDSEMKNITRYVSKCCNNVYLPSSDGIIRNDKTPDIDTKLRHLKSCQMIAYQSVPLPYTTKEGNYARCFE